MRPDRLVHLLAWDGRAGGALRSLVESACAVQGRGVDVTALLVGRDGAAAREASARLTDSGVTVRLLRPGLAGVPAVVRELRRTSGAPIVTHSERALLLARLAAPRARHVHVFHGFVGGSSRTRIREAVARRIAAFTGRAVAVDASLARRVPFAHLVPNCVDPAPIRAAAGAPGRLGDRPRIVFVGRLSEEKGAGALPAIAERIEALEPSARLVVAGPGAAPAFTTGNVDLLGEVPEAPPVIAGADVIILPSRTEAMPMVSLEAAALGTPVVAYPVGGLPDSGLAEIVAMGDVEALTAAALRLARPGPERAAAVEASRTALATRFSPGAHAEALFAVLSK